MRDCVGFFLHSVVLIFILLIQKITAMSFGIDIFYGLWNIHLFVIFLGHIEMKRTSDNFRIILQNSLHSFTAYYFQILSAGNAVQTFKYTHIVHCTSFYFSLFISFTDFIKSLFMFLLTLYSVFRKKTWVDLVDKQISNNGSLALRDPKPANPTSHCTWPPGGPKWKELY